MTGAERPAAVCARCGMAINYMLKTNGRADEPGFVWVHGGPADHDPVLAASAGPPRLYCDFCSAPAPGWVIDTDRDFQIVVVDRDGGSLTENFTGGWAACDQCAELVRAGQRRALLAGPSPAFPSPLPASMPPTGRAPRRFTPRSSPPARTSHGA